MKVSSNLSLVNSADCQQNYNRSKLPMRGYLGTGNQGLAGC